MKSINIVCQKNARTFIIPIIKRIQTQFIIKIFSPEEILNNKFLLNNSDIIWFEWGTEISAYIARQYPTIRKIIRIHSCEAYTNSIYKIPWELFSDTIFVANYIKNKVINSIPNFEQYTKTHVISNGVDTNLYSLKSKPFNFKICFAAYLKHVKNLPLLIQCFNALYKSDKRYQLFIAGKLEGNDLEQGEIFDYITHMLSALKLNNAIHFDGWVTDPKTWYEDKDFIVSTSIRESQGLNLAEGMCKGLMPIVHNFPAAHEHYPKNCIFNTQEEFVKIITSNTIRPEVWRTLAIDKFNIDDKVREIIRVLNA